MKCHIQLFVFKKISITSSRPHRWRNVSHIYIMNWSVKNKIWRVFRFLPKAELFFKYRIYSIQLHHTVYNTLDISSPSKIRRYNFFQVYCIFITVKEKVRYQFQKSIKSNTTISNYFSTLTYNYFKYCYFKLNHSFNIQNQLLVHDTIISEPYYKHKV